ncbi:MAG: flavin reductase (DIM6/NTAB) family NADH-FMN oxidoreductase RutF [Porticoccaceae bacterium]|jgi:flavin reductase (DIM6/NTAB) family NADH-FMN oxidoreductase RutF
MAFDPAEQRRIMGSFATGVTVVTTNSEPPTGLTANAVTSLSLDPPLVLVAVDKKAGSHQAIKDSGCFAMNILTSKQQGVSNKFATPGPKDFSDLDIKTAETGAPIIADSLGWVDCKLTEILAGGDHDIFIGEIVAGELNSGDPLLYFAGKYRDVAPLDE